MFKFLKKYRLPGQSEKGQSFILVLILCVSLSIIIVPLLSFTITGLNSGKIFEKKTAEYYAADAGVQDAIWQIRYDHVQGFTTPFAYNPYDYTGSWNDPSLSQINGKPVNVSIQNVWIPYNNTAPSTAQARNIVEGSVNHLPRLFVLGSTVQTNIPDGANRISKYQIEVSYYPNPGEQLYIDSISVWLPHGFDYYSYSQEAPGAISTRSSANCGGNKAITWTYGTSGTLITGFTNVGVTDYPMSLKSTFYFKPPQNQVNLYPEAMAWVNTHGADLNNDGNSNDFAWDANVQVYKIHSVCGGTTIDSYLPQTVTRQLSSAISGDYAANGNALLIDNDSDPNVRETHVASSDAIINSIPQDADVKLAYLYWSGWKDESYKTLIYNDPCTSFNSGQYVWDHGNAWSIYNYSSFRGSIYNNGNGQNLLYRHNPIDLHTYASATHAVAISWDQWVSGTAPGAGDGLDFAISADGGATWTSNFQAFRGNISGDAQNFSYVIPYQFLSANFKIRFTLVGFSQNGQYCNIDNIKIADMTPFTGVQFKINGAQVYFDSNGNPAQGNQNITADSSQIIPNTINAYPSPSGTWADGYSYSCKKDVTALVKAYAAKAPAPAINCPGNAKYTVGDATLKIGDNFDTVDNQAVLAYAGWSIVVVYTSPTTLGHQLYLYDKFLFMEPTVNRGDLDFDGNGQPGGMISGFIVPNPIIGESTAARITCFVGEGDEIWSGDFLAFNAPSHYRTDTNAPNDPQNGIPDSYKLWDGTTSGPYPALNSSNPPMLSNNQSQPDNVWNGKFKDPSGTSTAAVNGVDIDSFTVPWIGGRLQAGDTSANIDICSSAERWNLIYMILSFRSANTTGDLLNYTVK